MVIFLPCSEKWWTADTPETLAEQQKVYQTTPEAAFPAVLQSLLSPMGPSVVPCSAFGGYVLLHAVLQQVWHIRQATPNGPVRLETVEVALKKWQAMRTAHPESQAFPRSLHEPLLFNSNSLLRLAYVRLIVDFSQIGALFISGNTSAIPRALMSYPKNVQRSSLSTDAAVHALDTLRAPIKLGLHSPARISASMWDSQHHFFSLECC